MKIIQFQLTDNGHWAVLSDEGKLYYRVERRSEERGLHYAWSEVDYPIDKL